MLSDINKLRERLDKLLADENANREEILKLSRELDELIVAFIRNKDNKDSGKSK